MRCLRDFDSMSKFLKFQSDNLETFLENKSQSSHVLKREVSATGIRASLNHSLKHEGQETAQEIAIGRRGWIRLKDIIDPEKTQMLSGSELTIQCTSMFAWPRCGSTEARFKKSRILQLARAVSKLFKSGSGAFKVTLWWNWRHQDQQAREEDDLLISLRSFSRWPLITIRS